MPGRKIDFFTMKGGVIQNVTQWAMPAGSLIGALNHESTLDNGYRRIDGNEAFDGQLSPSEQGYWVLNFTAGSSAISEGDTLNGAGGAAGTVLLDAIITSGTYGSGTAAGYVILGVVTGTFVDAEALDVGAGQVAACSGTQIADGISDATLSETYRQIAIETQRALILAVPGSGVIRGVWYYNDAVYALRDNVGGTKTEMYKSSSSGWVLQSFGETVEFTSGGVTPIVDGDTITGGTSGCTATVGRIVVQSGSWAGADAAGYIMLSGKSTNFQAENLDVGASSNLATIAGDSTAVSLSTGGYFEFTNFNFFGSEKSEAMYACDGVNMAWEWYEGVFTWIKTGATTDTPSHIAAHKYHLFLAQSGSAMHSSTGDPYDWDAAIGNAGEIGVGDTCTGFLNLSGDVLGVFARNNVFLLYGSDADDWDLKTHTRTSGAIANTIQRIGNGIYYDDEGIKLFSTTDQFGDFSDGVISDPLDVLVKAQKTKITTSVVSRQKRQYRIFFNDNTAIYATVKSNAVEFMPVELDHQVLCAVNSEDSSGNEYTFFGSDDGFIYQLDKGTNFNGGAVDANLQFPFKHQGMVQQKKRYHSIILNMNPDVKSNIVIKLTTAFSDWDPGLPSSNATNFNVTGSAAAVVGTAVWGDFFWDGQSATAPYAYISGVGINMAMTFASTLTYELPYTIYGATIHYSIRGLRR